MTKASWDLACVLHSSCSSEEVNLAALSSFSLAIPAFVFLIEEGTRCLGVVLLYHAFLSFQHHSTLQANANTQERYMQRLWAAIDQVHMACLSASVFFSLLLFSDPLYSGILVLLVVSCGCLVLLLLPYSVSFLRVSSAITSSFTVATLGVCVWKAVDQKDQIECHGLPIAFWGAAVPIGFSVCYLCAGVPFIDECIWTDKFQCKSITLKSRYDALCGMFHFQVALSLVACAFLFNRDAYECNTEAEVALACASAIALGTALCLLLGGGVSTLALYRVSLLWGLLQLSVATFYEILET